VAHVSATHKRDQTVAGPPQSPTRSERERERERKREREKFIDNQIDE